MASSGEFANHDTSSAVELPQLRHEPFELTDIQHAYWFGRRAGLELGGVSGHLYLEFEIPGLDVRRLAEALRKVIDRHDMLRAVIDSDGRQRVQRQVPPYQIAVRDLRGRADAEKQAELDRIRNELRDQVLPADRWPLFDVRVTFLDADPGENTARLHLSIDLMFVDIPSVLRMMTEWRRFYDEPAWSPAPLTLSFRDYVVAAQALRADGAGARAEDYWLSRLESLPPAPDLPLAVAPEQLGRPGFVHQHAAMARDRFAALAATAERRGIPASVLLLAAYSEVLRTWSKSQQLTVTVTSLDRLPLHPQVHDVLGEFTAPSLLAVTGGPEQTFERRVADVQRQLVEDLSHSGFSGIRVMRELTRRQRDGRASMPVVFSSMLDVPAAEAAGDALCAFGELIDTCSQTPQILAREPDLRQGRRDHRQLERGRRAVPGGNAGCDVHRLPGAARPHDRRRYGVAADRRCGAAAG